MVTEADLQTYTPILASQINAGLSAGQLTFNRNEDIEVRDITFPKATPKKIDNIVSFTGDANLANAATYEGAQNVLRNIIPDVYSNQNPLYKQTFDYALNNPDKFKVDFEKRGERAYINVSLNTGTETNPEYMLVKGINVSDKSMETIRKTLNVLPQSFITLALAQMGVEVRANGAPKGSVAYKMYQLSQNQEQ